MIHESPIRDLGYLESAFILLERAAPSLFMIVAVTATGFGYQTGTET